MNLKHGNLPLEKGKEIRMKRIGGKAVPFKSFSLPKDIKEPMLVNKEGKIKAFSPKKGTALLDCNSWFELNGIEKDNPQSLSTVLTELNIYRELNSELEKFGHNAPKVPAGYVNYFTKDGKNSYYSIFQLFGNAKINMSQILDKAHKSRDKSFFDLVKSIGEWEKFYEAICNKQGIELSNSKKPSTLTIYRTKKGLAACPLTIEPETGSVETSNFLESINLPYMAGRLKCSKTIANEIESALSYIQKGKTAPKPIETGLLKKFAY